MGIDDDDIDSTIVANPERSEIAVLLVRPKAMTNIEVADELEYLATEIRRAEVMRLKPGVETH